MSEVNKETVEAAKSFDIGAFMRHVGSYSKPFKVHLRHDLLAQMDDIKARIDAAPGGEEQSMDEVGDKATLVAEYNRLLDEFEADAISFQFRPSTRTDWEKARDRLAETLPENVKIDDVPLDDLLPFIWAETLIEPAGITGQDLQQIRVAIGDAAIAAEIGLEFEKANHMGQLGAADAPFSRSRLPVLDKSRRGPQSGQRSG